MIETQDISKSFDHIKAIDQVSITIKEGSIFGLIGTNGSGKSTLLRLLCGILKQDEGSITIDNQPVYNQRNTKKLFYYISDEQFFFTNSTPRELMKYYQIVYENFNETCFHTMMQQFDLDEKRKINTFSKGMKKQLSVICGISASTKYLFCDETFDGLDPVMRQTVKSILANEMEVRNMTTIIASHNMRELEDICDSVALLHKGKMVLSKDLDEMKLAIHKVQCVFHEPMDIRNLLNGYEIIHLEQRGLLNTVTVRGDGEELKNRIVNVRPDFYEIVPLSLDEIFISEMEENGYDIKKLMF